MGSTIKWDMFLEGRTLFWLSTYPYNIKCPLLTYKQAKASFW